jgi:hypothetical protein
MSNHEAEARLGQRTLVPSESMRQRRQTSGANALKALSVPDFSRQRTPPRFVNVRYSAS